MKVFSIPVYYPEDYNWWSVSLRREVGGISIWIGRWRRFYFIRR
jgi:hypothetical protein